jgi:hypothetical protein
MLRAALFVELKTVFGRLSEEQLFWQRILADNYVVVNDLETFQRMCDTLLPVFFY